MAAVNKAVQLVLLAAMLATQGCKGNTDKSKATASPQSVLTVRVAPAEVRSQGEALTLTGAIAAWQSVSVSPEANGLQVLDVRVDEGQRVRKGQVLAVLDNRLLQAQAQDARGRLDAALANQRDARYNYDRYKALRAEGGVTGPEMSQRAATLASANGTATQARAALAQLQVQLSQSRVVAPTDGLVLQRSVQIGDLAAPGKAMFTLARNGRLEMDANVAEADLARVRLGQAATVSSNVVPGLKATGHVEAVSPALSTTSRLATVKIGLPANTAFRVGMFATATVQLGRRSQLAVPADALTNRNGQAIVFIVGDDRVVHARTVTAGDAFAGWVPVTAGLEPGEKVVTDGVGFLKEGDHVTVSDRPAATGATSAASPNPAATPSSLPTAANPAQPAHGGPAPLATAAPSAATVIPMSTLAPPATARPSQGLSSTPTSAPPQAPTAAPPTRPPSQGPVSLPPSPTALVSPGARLYQPTTLPGQ